MKLKPTVGQVALSIAVALHVALLWAMPAATGEKTPIRQTKEIAVRLVTLPQQQHQPAPVVEETPPLPTPEPESKPKPKPKPEPEPEPKPVPKPQLKSEQKSQARPDRPTESKFMPEKVSSHARESEQVSQVVHRQAEPATTPAPSAPPPGLNDFLNQVRTMIESHQNYPFAARRRNLEGEVLLQIAINANGNLSQVEISRSSGYQLLDQAAQKAVRAAAPFPAPTGFRLGDVRFAIPITFNIIR